MPLAKNASAIRLGADTYSKVYRGSTLVLDLHPGPALTAVSTSVGNDRKITASWATKDTSTVTVSWRDNLGNVSGVATVPAQALTYAFPTAVSYDASSVTVTVTSAKDNQPVTATAALEPVAVNVDGNLFTREQYDAGSDLSFFNTEGGGLALSKSTAWSFVGPSSVKVTCTSSTAVTVASGINTGGPAGHTQRAAVTAGRTYTVSVTVKNTNMVVPLELQIKWRDAADALLSASTQTTGTTIPVNGQATISYTAAAPANATKAIALLRFVSQTPVQDNAYYTDGWTCLDTTPPPVNVSTDIGAPAPSLAYDATAGTRNADLWPFMPNSVWNLSISNDAVLSDGTDAASASFAAPAGGVWINQPQFSHPIFYARDSDVFTGWTDTKVTARSGAFKSPPGATRANGTDRHMHIMGPYGRWADENIGVSPSDAANPGLGGTVTRHQRVDLYGNGIGPQNGVRAYGGSAVGGLIRAWEVDTTHPSYDGELHHALAFALAPGNQLYTTGSAGYDTNGNGTAMGYVWPATEEDYNAPTSYTGSVPMGALFAIPASVDINSLGLSSDWAKMMGRALQNYGAYNTDTSTLMTFYVEPSAPTAFRTALLANSAADLAILVGQLRRVTNNAASTPGGGAIGSTRRKPDAYPLAALPTVTPYPQSGAITYVGTTTQTSSSLTTLTATKPTGTVTGDVLYTFGTVANSKTITPPADMTQVAAITAGARKLYVWRKVVADGDTSWAYTMSAANNQWYLRTVVYRGVDATTPEAGTLNRASSSALRSWALGPVTTAKAGEVLLAAGGFDKAPTAIWDERTTTVSTSTALVAGYKWIDTPRVEAVNLNLSAASAGASIVLRLNPATTA